MIAFFKKLPPSLTQFFFATPALIWQCFFVLIPLAIIFLSSFISFNNVTSIQIKAISVSAFLAYTTMIFCLMLGYAIAYFIVFKSGRFKNFFTFLLMIPFWTNILILVYAWFFVLAKNGIINTFLLYTGIIREPLTLLYTLPAIVLGMIYCYLPFMILPLLNSLETIDPLLLDASLDLGASEKQTFKHVILPLTFNGIKTGSILVFVLAFGDYVIPLLMGGDKFLVVGSLITHYFITSADWRQGAFFVLMSSIVLVVLVSIFIIFLKQILFQKRHP